MTENEVVELKLVIYYSEEKRIILSISQLRAVRESDILCTKWGYMDLESWPQVIYLQDQLGYLLSKSFLLWEQYFDA